MEAVFKNKKKKKRKTSLKYLYLYLHVLFNWGVWCSPHLSLNKWKTPQNIYVEGVVAAFQ